MPEVPKVPKVRLFCAAAVMACALPAAAVARQDKPAPTIWDGVYSSEQAARGRDVYRKACVYCHKTDLSGGSESGAPALAGRSFLTKWGREGAGPGQFKAPWGIACDALGNVYVVDTGNHRIQKFDGNGTFLCAWGNRGKSEGQLNFPYGIAVDREGCVYVVDSGNNRVLKYVPTEEEINRGKEDKPKSQSTTATPASIPR